MFWAMCGMWGQKTWNLLKMLIKLYLGQGVIWALRRIGRFVLFLCKNNQEGWIESEAYLEPSQTSTMKLFWAKIVNGFFQKSSMLPVWLDSKSLIPSTPPYDFCVKIIQTSQFFSTSEVSSTPWKIKSNYSYHVQ